MIIIVGIFIIALAALFIFIAVSLWKKLRKTIIGVRNGNLKNQIVSKMIKKAETTGKVEYTIYRPLIGSVILSAAYVFINYITSTYLLELGVRVGDSLFTFGSMFLVWSVIGIIVSNKIWNLCRQQ